MTSNEAIKFTTNTFSDTFVITDYFHLWSYSVFTYVLAMIVIGGSLVSIERVVEASRFKEKLFWSVFSGASLGFGIWAAYCASIEAFGVYIPLNYDIYYILLSILFSIFFSCIALSIYAQKQSLRTTITVLTLGVGINTIYYVGMAAVEMTVNIHYSFSSLFSSIIVAMLTAIIVLFIGNIFVQRNNIYSIKTRIVTSFLLAIAILGTYFFSTEIISFIFYGIQEHLGSSLESSGILIFVVIVLAILQLTLNTVAATFKNERESKSLYLERIQSLNSELRLANLSLQSISFNDPVTGLKNRVYFNKVLEQTINRCLDSSEAFALILIDIDNFKRINDSLGHSIGDRVLVAFADRLNNLVEPTNVVARYGGDEFIVLIADSSLCNVNKLVERLLSSGDEIKLSAKKTVSVSTSIGIVQYPKDGKELSELIRNADIAMFKAKDVGKACYRCFDEKMHREISRSMILENELKIAIKNDELDVNYQPIIDINTGEIVQLEALARWNLKGESISPEEFIGIAEEFGLINQLGLLVFKKVLKCILDINGIESPPLKISINLSPVQFQDDDLIATIKNVLTESEVQPSQIEFEITEGCLIQDFDSTREKLFELIDIGVSISIDDFGIGYSSLSYLKKLPIDKLKIDRSFVKSLPNDLDDIAINEAVIKLAHHLGMKVVAEGVESAEQAAFLISKKCDLLQGYFISKALSKEELKKYLLTRTKKHDRKVKKSPISYLVRDHKFKDKSFLGSPDSPRQI